MYQQNPLLEYANKTLLKKRELYTPEQWKSIIQRLHLTDPKIYGERVIEGQIKRLKSMFPDAEIVLKNVDIARKSGTVSRYLPQRICIKFPNNQTFKLPILKRSNDTRKELKHAVKNYSYIVQNPDKEAIRKLSAAEILTHEVDEAAMGVKNFLKWNRKHPDMKFDNFYDYCQFIKYYREKILKLDRALVGRHNAGVLNREAKRHHLLTTRYGRGSFLMPYRKKAERKFNNMVPTKNDYIEYMKATGWDI